MCWACDSSVRVEWEYVARVGTRQEEGSGISHSHTPDEGHHTSRREGQDTGAIVAVAVARTAG